MKYMKKLLVLFGAFLVVNSATAQVKDSFELRSIPTFDMDGNVYIVVKRYSQKPTAKDSLDFEVYRKAEVSRMIREVEEKEKNKRRNDKVSRPAKRN